MANLPFGFGPMSAQQTAQPTRGGSTKKLMKQINFGMRNAPMGRNGMGAVMGFMGLPFMSKGNGAGEGSGGPWMTVDPRNLTMSPGGWGGLGGGGSGLPQIEDPPLPPYDPNNPPGGGGGGGGVDPRLLELLFPPQIGTGAQWRNTMKYGA